MNIQHYKPSMKITAPMLVIGMPNEIYHSHNSASKSALDLVARSPAHFKYAPPRESTRQMEIGTAIHTALLEPERFASEYVLLRDVTDRRSSEYKAAIKEHPAERVLTGKEADKVAGMQESVYVTPDVSELLSQSGYREISVFATDPETGVMVRARFDILNHDGGAVDLKKTQDARAEAFSRAIDNYRYHVQDAFYSDVFLWATGNPLKSFKFLAVEQELPHACKVYQLDETSRQEGRRLYREALNTYAHCLQTGHWPAYPTQADEIISLPPWRMNQIENEIEQELY